MKLAPRSACAAAALRRPEPQPCAPCDPKGRQATGAAWLRCRAQSAARSCSRSTGKTRPVGAAAPSQLAERGSAAAPGAAAGRVPGSRQTGAPETPGKPVPKPLWWGTQRAEARAPGSASFSPRIPALPLVFSHQCPFSEQPLGPPRRLRLGGCRPRVLTGGPARECDGLGGC